MSAINVSSDKRKLPNHHEVVGVLLSVEEKNGSCRLQFSFIEEIEIPSVALSQKKLMLLIGKRIGIFHCDGSYTYRVITGKYNNKS
jgi:hypothetical protein